MNFHKSVISTIFFLTLLIATASAQSVWTRRTSGTTVKLNSVASAGTQLVAVGNGGTILTSPNGMTWTARTSGTTRSLYSVIWAGTQFVAVGYAGTTSPIGIFLTSPDGITWTVRDSTRTACGPRSVAWSGSLLMAVGGGISGTTPYYNELTSPDGVTWTGGAATPGSPLYVVTWVGNNFKTQGIYGYTVFLSAIWTSSLYVAVGSNALANPPGEIWASINGSSLVKRDSLTTSRLQSVTWTSPSTGAGQLVAVGDNGTIRASPNGVTWTSHTSGVLDTLMSVTSTSTLLVAVGSGGTIITSPQDPVVAISSYIRSRSPEISKVHPTIFPYRGHEWKANGKVLPPLR